MGISIKRPETVRLVREVAALTGESLTQAVHTALQEQLDRLRGRPPKDASPSSLGAPLQQSRG